MRMRGEGWIGPRMQEDGRRAGSRLPDSLQPQTPRCEANQIDDNSDRSISQLILISTAYL